MLREYFSSHLPIQRVFRAIGIICTPVEMQLQNLILSSKVASTQDTHISRQGLYHVKLLGNNDKKLIKCE